MTTVRRAKQHRSFAETATTPLIAGGLAVLALDVARRVFRHTQLFCPSHEPEKSWNPADYGIKRESVDELWFETDDGEMLHGWYCKADHPIASGVLCHGNTGNLTTIATIIPPLQDSGINVLIFDYRGFGKSTGSPSFAGVVGDAITAGRFHDTIRPKHLPSILYGYSLGGAIAAQAIRHHPFDGLILQSTFTNLPDMAKATWPRLPLHLVAGSVFDTKNVLKHLNVPLLVIHGSADESVPCWMAHQLYDACQSNKKLFIVDGGLHKDCFVRDPDNLVWAINQFASQLPPRPQQLEFDPPSAVDHWIDAAFRYVRRHLRRVAV
ncbi:MAG TPA: alpha/beta fold hydrolase [Thermoanaerobaculia bacterium]